METICAISTPNAIGGISVLRISGEQAIEIASKVFQPYGEKIVEKMEGYTCCYGKVMHKGSDVDDGVLTVFRAPKSYTGEDVCEISCHGGIYVTKQVFRAILANGARPAQAGEFTKRALLNRKLSLTQAEAVMDMIMAQGEQAHRCAVASHEGVLYERIHSITERLVTILGELAAWVDYPEEDLPAIEIKTLDDSLDEIIAHLSELIRTYDSGRILRTGIDIAIVGKPNVGKSTLMNLLLGFQRSIVTEIAGTTRDVVEESVRIGDLVLKLSDTAGIRTTDDIVEGVGVSLSYKKIKEADLVIVVFDNSMPLTEEDLNLFETLSEKTCIAVLNKSDLLTRVDRALLTLHFDRVIDISAINGNGAEKLISELEAMFAINQYDVNAGMITNERQKQCVEIAKINLEKALEALRIGETFDAITVLIDEAANSLLVLTGEKATDAVIDEVFANFCVGK